MSSARRFLTSELPKPGKPILLEKDEAHHALKVLRLEDGDPVFVLNGNGLGVSGVIRIRKSEKSQVWIENDGDFETEAPRSILPIHLEMAALKGDSMDWVIEKAVELGVQKLTPILTDFTVVQIHRKGAEAFQDRWQSIADQALKQCERLTRLQIEPPIDLAARLTQLHAQAVFWMRERSIESTSILRAFLNSSASSFHLLIGPEGGFSPDEIILLERSQNVQQISLSPLVLRAETAAISAVAIAAEYLRDKS